MGNHLSCLRNPNRQPSPQPYQPAPAWDGLANEIQILGLAPEVPFQPKEWIERLETRKSSRLKGFFTAKSNKLKERKECVKPVEQLAEVEGRNEIEMPVDNRKDSQKDSGNHSGNDSPQNSAVDSRNDSPQDRPNDSPQDIPEDIAEDIPEEIPEDIPEEIPQDRPNELLALPQIRAPIIPSQSSTPSSYASDTNDFGSIRRRMYSAMPVAKLLIEFNSNGIFLEAENTKGDGFSIMCEDKLVTCISGEDDMWSQEKRKVQGDIGAEAAAILMEFLVKAKENSKEIGKFHVRCQTWEADELAFHLRVRKQFLQVFQPPEFNVGEYIMEQFNEKRVLVASEPSTYYYAHYIGPTGPAELIPELTEEPRQMSKWETFLQVTEDKNFKECSLEAERVVQSFCTTNYWRIEGFEEQEPIIEDMDQNPEEEEPAVDDIDQGSEDEEEPAMEDMDSNSEEESAMDDIDQNPGEEPAIEDMNPNPEEEEPTSDDVDQNPEEQVPIIEDVDSNSEEEGPAVDDIDQNPKEQVLIIEAKDSNPKEEGPVIDNMDQGPKEEKPIIEPMVPNPGEESAINDIDQNPEAKPAVEAMDPIPEAEEHPEEQEPAIDDIDQGPEEEPAMEDMNPNPEEQEPIIDDNDLNLEEEPAMEDMDSNSDEEEEPIIDDIDLNLLNLEEEGPINGGYWHDPDNEEDPIKAVYQNPNMPNTFIKITKANEMVVDFEGATYTFRKI